jgi:hypothetical protein
VVAFCPADFAAAVAFCPAGFRAVAVVAFCPADFAAVVVFCAAVFAVVVAFCPADFAAAVAFCLVGFVSVAVARRCAGFSFVVFRSAGMVDFGGVRVPRLMVVVSLTVITPPRKSREIGSRGDRRRLMTPPTC